MQLGPLPSHPALQISSHPSLPIDCAEAVAAICQQSHQNTVIHSAVQHTHGQSKLSQSRTSA